MPQRLFENDARSRGEDISLGEVLADRDEEFRRRREIEGAHAIGIAERRLQRAEGLGLERIGLDHRQAAQEGRDLLGREAFFIEAVGDLLGQPLEILRLADDGEDAALFRQHAFPVALRQRGKELAQGEIAAGSEDHQIEGRHRGALGRSLGPQRAIGDGIHRVDSVLACDPAPLGLEHAGCDKNEASTSLCQTP